ncbi:MAG: tRNA (adenine-N1)-methyltransferase [Anaerolineales bacterium]|nr:tRNA (adenine-N1)-methyltransferase [Anaerolineales bacterium]
MPWNLTSTHARAGDLAQLVGLRHKHFIITLVCGGDLHTHRGILKHDDLIGLPWGSQVFSHQGSPFFLLQPSLADVLTNLPRNTQIMYPKDIGFILSTMSVGPGQRVLEAGTGSGSMTVALAFAVGPEGRVISYERRPEFQTLAHKNLSRLGLEGRVDFKLGDAADGFTETDVDAFFLDVANPWDYVTQVRAALKPGGFFANLVPTFNQVETLLHALRRENFAFVEVCELLLRYYKPEPSRLRPTDRMVAHTGFLTFARRIEPSNDERARDLLKEAGMIGLDDRAAESGPEGEA